MVHYINSYTTNRQASIGNAASQPSKQLLMAVTKGQAATMKETLYIDEKLTWKQIGLLFASISPLSKASWLLDWFLLLHIKMIQRTEQKKL